MSLHTRARKRQRPIPWCSAALVLAGAGLLARTAEAQTTFTVIHTADSGAGSLRQAILDANASAGTDTIAFNIPAAGPHVITPATTLPSLTDPVVVDGYTQPGASPNTNPPELGSNAVLQIQIGGGSSVSFLEVRGGSSTIRGLALRRMQMHSGDDNVIEGNFLGFDATGVNEVGYKVGLFVFFGTHRNTIGGTTPAARNVIWGWENSVVIQDSDGNVVQGNLIGTDRTGTATPTVGNGGSVFLGGVRIRRSDDNVIGGTTAAARNVISGNFGSGIALSGDTANNQVLGNYVGVDVTGTAVMRNYDGIVMGDASTGVPCRDHTISGNVIGGNRRALVLREGATGILVEGNWMGTDPTATLSFACGGIELGRSSFNTIRANTLAFSQGNAVTIHLESTNNTLEANTITTNSGDGVYMVHGNTGFPSESIFNNRISQNSISSNGGLGINLGNITPIDGVTPNDSLDADTGANGLQNFPVLNSAVSSTLTTTISGTLDTAPSGSYTLEFFANSACDPSDHGEGETYLGDTAVTTDGVGHASFSVALSVGGVTGCMTATATDASGNTSEFSACLAIVTITPPDPNLSTIEVDPAVISAFGGQSDITVTPRDELGGLIGSGLSVTVATTLGVLDPAVVDILDGTYNQTLIGNGSGGTAMVTATVEGVPLTSAASVTLVPVDPALSTIAVDPSTTYLGGHATITVTPVDDLGQNAGAGFTVAIQTTMGTLVGAVQDHGDGTYTQGIDATVLCTASITATVNGLPLDVSGSLTVSDPANVGDVIGLQVDGTAFPYGTIQEAVDDVVALSFVKILVSPGTYEEIVHVKKLGTALEFEALSALSLVTVRGFHVDKSADVTIGYFDIDANGKGKHGLHVKGTDKDPTTVTVHDCVIQHTKKGKAGVRIKGKSTTVLLANSQVANNGDDGIEVAHEAVLTVTGCVIESNGDNGVKLEKHVVATISGSTIRDNGLNGNDKKGYGIFRKRDGQGGTPEDVTLIGNVLADNRGKVVPGSSDESVGNYDQIIDPTDNQLPY